MNLNDLPKKSEKLVNQVTGAVEKTSQKVVNKVSDLTNGTEEITEEAIEVAVNQAINILQIAKEKVSEKDINGGVTLEVSIGIVNIAHLKITNDVTDKDAGVDVEIG